MRKARENSTRLQVVETVDEGEEELSPLENKVARLRGHTERATGAQSELLEFWGDDNPELASKLAAIQARAEAAVAARATARKRSMVRELRRRQ